MKKCLSYIGLFILLFTLNFVSHTVQFQNMGLYEDDYGFIGRTINYTEDEYSNYITNTWTKSFQQGRPLGFTIPQVFAYQFRSSGSLDNLYLGGALILTINAILSFSLIRTITKSNLAAILGGILVSLYPADTTKSYLLHMYHIQTSLMFSLAGVLIYVKNPKLRFISYIFGFASLITYESPFTLLILMPLFSKEVKNKKEWISHFLFIGLIIVLILGARAAIGESRVSGLGNYPTTVAQIIASTVMGPVVSMGLFLYGPARTVLHMNQELWVVISIASFAMILFLMYMNKASEHEIKYRNSEELKDVKFFSIAITLPFWIWEWIKSLFVALVWLMSSYLLAFTHFPPVVRYGRGTSVHVAATVPAALLATLILWGIWKMLANYKYYRMVYVVLMALYFGITIGNRYSIQQDFVKSWDFQKQFWHEVVDLVPDVDDGTVIFVVNHNLPEEHYILSNTWTDYMILDELIEFPAEWNKSPMVLTTDGNWENRLNLIDGEIKFPWNIYWNFSIDPENVILLTDTPDGHLIRVNDGEIHTLSGINIKSKVYHETISLSEKYSTTRLYDIMIPSE